MSIQDTSELMTTKTNRRHENVRGQSHSVASPSQTDNDRSAGTVAQTRFGDKQPRGPVGLIAAQAATSINWVGETVSPGAAGLNAGPLVG